MVAPREGLLGASLGSTLDSAGAPSVFPRSRVKGRTAGAGLSTIPRLAVGLPRSTKRLLMLVADAAILPFALAIAISLRASDVAGAAHVGDAFLWISLCGVASLSVFGLYRTVTRFVGARVVVRIVLAITLSMVAFGFVNGLTHTWHVRYSAIAIAWAFAVLFVAGSRATVQYLCLLGIRTGTRRRIAIYGAGDAGARLSRFLIGGSEFQVVAFVDDQEVNRGGVACFAREQHIERAGSALAREKASDTSGKRALENLGGAAGERSRDATSRDRDQGEESTKHGISELE